MTNKLTVKQEKFCADYLELGDASKAYRKAYNASKMKSETVNVKASELLNNGKVTVRIKELQKSHQERHNITVDTLLVELEQARKLSESERKGAAMVSATMGKARLLGFDKQIQVLNEKKTIVVNVIKPPSLTH